MTKIQPGTHQQTFSIASRTGAHAYTVTQWSPTQWSCECKDWTYRRRACWHIQQARLQTEAGPAQRPEPRIVFAHVDTVTPHDPDTLYVPLLPVGDTHFLATLCFDLYRHGIRWPTIQSQYRLPADWTKEKIFHYIDHYGRKLYHITTQNGRRTVDYRIERTWELPDLPHHQEGPDAYHQRTGLPLDLAKHLFTTLPADTPS